MSDIKQPTLNLPTPQKPWTSSELNFLKANAGKGVKELAILMDRTEESIRQAARRNRISIRKQGERRGLLLGQPKGTSWKELRKSGITAERLEAIKAEALAGLIDLGELEKQIAEIAKGKQRELCPHCVSRYIDRPATGLCAPCHLKILARLHQDQVDIRNAERALWAARQENSRNRRRDTESSE